MQDVLNAVEVFEEIQGQETQDITGLPCLPGMYAATREELLRCWMKEIKYRVSRYQGRRFRHKKGGVYTLLTVGRHTETKEWQVSYTDADGDTHFRPLTMFCEHVLHEGKMTPRFQEDDPDSLVGRLVRYRYESGHPDAVGVVIYEDPDFEDVFVRVRDGDRISIRPFLRRRVQVITPVDLQIKPINSYVGQTIDFGLWAWGEVVYEDLSLNTVIIRTSSGCRVCQRMPNHDWTVMTPSDIAERRREEEQLIERRKKEEIF